MDLPFQPSMKALLLLSALAVCSLAQRFKVPVANKSAYIGQIDGAKGFASFLGIRYAQAPTENLRWRPPVPVSNSTPGDVDASTYGLACIATAISGDIPKEQAEDCLFLNVFLPFPQSTKILPVLVYFHGGGFQSGSARDIEPTHLFASTAQPFIFVTVQYRLGQFGFLSGTQVGKDGAYNVGMLDQRAGLRWVQQYIKYFGGDSKRVTIWGSSAGAGSTMFHLIANEGENEGLFNQAMGCSPSMSYMPEAGSAYDQSVFNEIASKVQCDSKDPNVLACLRKAPVKALANAGNSVAVARKPTVFVFAPRLESRGKFLSNRAVEAFKDGKFAQVSVLFGSNTNEGAGWADYGNDATEAKVYDFLRGQYAPFTNESFSKALDLYPVKDFKNPSGQGQQMYGEARYVCSANLITGNAKRLGLASYHYHYNNAHLGSNHGSENGAFFGPPAAANAEDTALFEDMRKFWTSFVTSGNPVVGDENGLKWEAVSLDTAGPRMRLDPQAGNMEPMDDALNARCNFWHGISKELET